MLKILFRYSIVLLGVFTTPIHAFTFISDVAPVIIHYEGSTYHNYDKDPGGPTKFGWTLKSYRQMVHQTASISDIKNLTAEQATLLYEELWWDKFGASMINDQDLATGLILAQINLGPYRPNKVLQGAVNAICNQHLKVDGVIGARTANAVNDCDVWPSYAFMLHDFYVNSKQIGPVWEWAQNGLKKRILHGVEN